MILTWLHRYRCKHHDPRTGETFIRSMLIDLGRSKIVYCARCGKDFR